MKKEIKKGIGIFSLILLITMVFITIMSTKISANSENTSIPKITYCAHVEIYGWMNPISTDTKANNKFVGTVGQSKRMEALKINFEAPKGTTLKCRAHVQDYGWMDWVTVNAKGSTNFAGTTGQSRRVEAFQIAVEGLDNYDIKYRVHVQDYGWMDWVTAEKSFSTVTTAKGTYAGTVGQSRRMEAIEISIVPSSIKNKVESVPQVQETPKTTPKVENKVESVPEVQDNVKEENNKQTLAGHTHNYTEWKTIVEPTCATAGEEERTCTTCHETETRKIYKTVEHTLVRESSKDVKATCTQKGKEYYICKVCNQEFFHVTLPLDHEWSKEKIVDKKATCEETGLKSYHCTREGCTETKNSETIPAISGDHVWETTTVEPTCTTDGTITTTCQKCGKTTVEIKQAVGHSFTNYTYNNDATCTSNGTETAHCTRCSAEITREATGTMKSHNFEELNDGKPATCKNSGLTATKVCKDCGYRIEQKMIPASGHSWLVSHANESTCTGSILVNKCEYCEATSISEKMVFGTGHTWDAEKKQCTVCGTKAPNWTNKWYGDVYLPTLKTVAEKYGVNDFNGLYAMHKEQELYDALKEKGGNRIRRVWAVFYITDTDKSEGFANGKYCTLDGKNVCISSGAMIDVTYNVQVEAPKPKPGYKFVGWYNAVTGEKVTENTKLINTWENMDKAFEPRYESI